LRPEAQVVPTNPGHARTLLIAAGLVVAVIGAYHNSLSAPFVFDDPLAITENPTIRRLWPLTDVLFPPRGEGLSVEGRPILNLTLAINYAFGGTSVRGYHVVNILIHALATLTLFGVVRRTLALPRLRERFGAAALPLAAIIALLWAVHPLQTESVTYVIQRAESLVALFYVLTFYCFVRGLAFHVIREKPPEARIWFGLAAAACFVGMATKEVMVSAPLMVLLFDRAFVTGTFRDTLRQRGWVHIALFSTWILLAVLVFRTGTRGGTAGFGINVTSFDYALTQFEAVTRYVWLSLWPHPLIFDYGTAWVEHAVDVLPYAIGLFTLIGITIVGWWRWPSVAFLGLLFFAVLSPTSSIVPGNRQTLAEHRMYLPLAAVVAGIVCTAYLVAGGKKRARGVTWIGILTGASLALLTVRRNVDYRSELALYHDTAVKRPRNGFARYNFGKALAETGRHADALPEYEAALRLMANAPGINYNLANSLVALGRKQEAIARYEAALQAEPRYARAHFNLGNVLVELGRREDARQHFAAAVQADPQFVEARLNLGGVLLELRQLKEAQEQFEHVLRRDSRQVLALFNLGNVCLLERRWAEAIRCFEAVIALQPDLAVARQRLEMAQRQERL
jgi:Tfp pilus assembly protein PilF